MPLRTMRERKRVPRNEGVRCHKDWQVSHIGWSTPKVMGPREATGLDWPSCVCLPHSWDPGIVPTTGV